MEQHLEFRCPECKSRRFGSRLLPNKKLKRTCHGHSRIYLKGELTSSECHFTWSEDDDWKYFIKVTTFENEKEFNKNKKLNYG